MKEPTAQTIPHSEFLIKYRNSQKFFHQNRTYITYRFKICTARSLGFPTCKILGHCSSESVSAGSNAQKFCPNFGVKKLVLRVRASFNTAFTVVLPFEIPPRVSRHFVPRGPKCLERSAARSLQTPFEVLGDKIWDQNFQV